MFKKTAPREELYFLKTGNYLLPFRGYFKNKKKLKEQLHEILEKSLTELINEWEKANNKSWTQRRCDIISNNDMCHSVQVMKLYGRSEKFFASFFVMT